MRFILLWVICLQVQIVLNPSMYGGPWTMINQSTNIVAQSRLFGLIFGINRTGVLAFPLLMVTEKAFSSRTVWRCDLVRNQRRKLCSTHHSCLEYGTSYYYCWEDKLSQIRTNVKPHLCNKICCCSNRWMLIIHVRTN